MQQNSRIFTVCYADYSYMDNPKFPHSLYLAAGHGEDATGTSNHFRLGLGRVAVCQRPSPPPPRRGQNYFKLMKKIVISAVWGPSDC